MVNFKKVILPLLAVGIAYASAQSQTECSISKGSDGKLVQQDCKYTIN